jgi:hypothetical protein
MSLQYFSTTASKASGVPRQAFSDRHPPKSANMLNNTDRSAGQRRSRFVPTQAPDLPSVEDLRTRAVLGRVRSPALAAVIASLAYPVREDWRTRL